MTLPVQPFGRTGHLSSRVIFGAAALGDVSQEVGDRALALLLQYGVNHIDVAASYGDAELRIAPWLKRHPNRFFVATKTIQRRAEGARRELEQSLKRLGCDSIDLWQLHNLSDPIEWDIALSAGGVLEAAIQARREGLVKAIGVTGHGVQVAAFHRRSLTRFDFDSVLLPFNYLTMQNSYFAGHFNALQSMCRERNVAVQTIKSIACRPWMGRERTAATWYEPLSDAGAIELAVHWAMGREGIFLISAGDIDLLPHYLSAARSFQKATSDGDMQALVGRLGLEPIFV